MKIHAPAHVILVACTALEFPNGMVAMFPREKGQHGARSLAFPGGKLNVGEGVRGCAVRELKEELGVSVAPKALKLVTCATAVRGSKTYAFVLFQTNEWKGRMTNDAYLAFVDPFNFDSTKLTYADRILMQNFRTWKEQFFPSPPPLNL